MGLINYTPLVDGTTAQASQVNTPFNAVFNEINGNLSAANLASNAVTTAKIADGAVTRAKFETGLLPPVGSIIDFAGTSAPSGWLLCYGQTLNASTNPEYADLYTAIGNIYGGSDNTDFVVPDLRGRVVAGQDDMGGTSANRLTNQSGGVDGDVLGDTGGAQTHTLTISEMPNHRHTHSLQVVGRGSTGTGSGDTQTSGTRSIGDESNTSYVGGGGAHNNVQPTIILNKIIKY